MSQKILNAVKPLDGIEGVVPCLGEPPASGVFRQPLIRNDRRTRLENAVSFMLTLKFTIK